jgi:LacI family transcriptional regulator
VAGYPGATLEFVGTEALTVEDGRRAAERITARDATGRPDAVFAANDLIALGLLQGLLQTREIRVPDDIALIGYDDIEFAAAAVVPLSSIRQPAQLIGAIAVELLLGLEPESAADGERRHVVYRPELVVRASTAG